MVASWRCPQEHQTPLHLAAKAGRHAAVALLLDFGVNTAAQDGAGMTAEDLAVGWVWSHEPVLKAFARHRAHANGVEL